jgi:hypothetical protein
MDDTKRHLGTPAAGFGGTMDMDASSTTTSTTTTTGSGSVIGVRSDVDLYSTGFVLDSEQNDDDDDSCEAKTYRTFCIPCNA